LSYEGTKLVLHGEAHFNDEQAQGNDEHILAMQSIPMMSRPIVIDSNVNHSGQTQEK
jgi:hypothetical protein